MAFDTAILQNPNTGQIKEAPIGFSWTMFFFGIFPPLFRGDWKWFCIILGLGLLFGLATFGLLGGLPGFVGAFVWNKSYLTGLIEKGYRVKGLASGGDISRLDAIAGFEVPRASPAAA